MMARPISFRHPREWTDLILASAAAFVLFSLLSVLSWGVCCLWGFVGLAFVALMVGVENDHLRNTSVKVTREAHPELFARVEEVAASVGVRTPDVFLSGARELNAFTRGVLSPVIVLNRGLLRAMDEDEVSFVLGHEMGHIRLNHFAIRTLLESSGVRVPLLVYLPLVLFRMLFLRGRLSRSMEYSADRSGLHACGSLEKAISTMVKLGTGKKVTPDQVRGAIDGSFRIDGEAGLLGRLLSSHPDLDDRVKELVRYSLTVDMP